ncbi:hypothetical protein EMCG_06449 [[Emmonsia] crescens]|uniref:Uncharacterized protein n=1 Tax=[Emmonsia] crescens TaxID=73230 RepID=A0A0G2J6U2_9EURO|nr:hypothetical protein EMCG_06449 [Emmonsia crescens UAMH 3008]
MYTEHNGSIGSSWSLSEKGRFCLIILYMKLQDSDDAYFSYNLDDPEYAADLLSDFHHPSPDTAGLDDDRLIKMKNMEQKWFEKTKQQHQNRPQQLAQDSEQDWEDIPDSDNESQLEDKDVCIKMLLHNMPIEKLSGFLVGMRFRRIVVQKRLGRLVVQKRLGRLASYYQNW